MRATGIVYSIVWCWNTVIVVLLCWLHFDVELQNCDSVKRRSGKCGTKHQQALEMQNGTLAILLCIFQCHIFRRLCEIVAAVIMKLPKCLPSDECFTMYPTRSDGGGGGGDVGRDSGFTSFAIRFYVVADDRLFVLLSRAGIRPSVGRNSSCRLSVTSTVTPRFQSHRFCCRTRDRDVMN